MNKELKELLYILYYIKKSPAEYIRVYRKMEGSTALANEFFLKGGCRKYSQPGLNTIGPAEPPEDKQYDDIMRGIEKGYFKAIYIGGPDYPYQLENIFSPPPVLFFRGRKMTDTFNIAIVGSRKCTKYGIEAASYISRSLSAEGITIVSGLALGIDSIAHREAIKEKGGSIAILGSGPDIIYPPENIGLYDDILGNGTVITEFAPGTPPLRKNFPVRNRIISGICSGVIIVEAGRRSGAMITGEIALSQNREVFAVPGSIFSDSSRGCHRLIKSGAKLVECIDDILEEFQYIFRARNTKNSKGGEMTDAGAIKDKKAILTPGNARIYNSIGYRAISIDTLSMKCGMPVKDLINTLTFLEMEELISEGPSNHYKRSD